MMENVVAGCVAVALIILALIVVAGPKPRALFDG
jgi:hypothetical protein